MCAESRGATLLLQLNCGVGLISEHWLVSSQAMPLETPRRLYEPWEEDLAVIQQEGAEVLTKVQFGVQLSLAAAAQLPWPALLCGALSEGILQHRGT